MSDAPQTLTITEAHALLDALMPTQATHKQHLRGLRNYTLAMVMLEAGLRVGELIKLRWEHLFYNSLPVTSIIISQDIAEKGAIRQIPVSTRLSNALTSYHAAFATRFTQNNRPAFCRHTGNVMPLTTRQVERIIRTAALAALGRPVHPHVLRHTFASKLMRVTNARVVQELLGHQHLSSTQVYCHPNGEDLRNAIDTVTTHTNEAEDTLLTDTTSTDLPENVDAVGTNW